MRCYVLASIILALLVTAFGAGCSGEQVPRVPRDEPTVVQDHRDEQNGPAGAEALVALAQEDLARRLALPSDAIRLVSVEAVTWADASLGCPEPGLMYAQVVTPGFLVLLEADDQAYEYHTDTERLVVLCGDDGRPAYPLIPVDPGEIMDGKPWMPAD